MPLPTNYQDAIFEGRRKYQMVTNSDGTYSFVDVTNYTQEGSRYGASEINAQNQAINDLAVTGGNRNLAVIEDGTTATQAYTVGEYVIVNGLFYKVTSAIAIGDTLEEGVNISNTRVGTELVGVNQNLTTKPNYNFDEDRFYVYHPDTDTWVRSIRAWTRSVKVYDNGVFAYPYANSITYTNWSATNDGGWSIENDRIGVVNCINNHYRAIGFNELIDFTNYSRITVTTSRGNFTLNIEEVNQSGYITLMRTNGVIYCRVNERLDNSNYLASASLPNADSSTTYIYSVVLE